MASRRNRTAKRPVAEARAVEALESRRLLAGFSAHVNFQPSRAATPAGYVADAGARYGARNGLTYGWSANLSAYAVDRNARVSPDQRHDTLIATQAGGAATKWEIAVPTGQYSVHVVAGDAASFRGFVYKYNVEGAPVVSGVPTTSARWVEGTATVNVADGKLTIANAPGSVGNRIDYVDITQVTPTPPATLAPPAAPIQVPTSASDGDLGINLAAVQDWSTDAPFVDAKNLFRTWGDYDAWWQRTSPIPLTADGYPLANAAAGATLSGYPAGVYHLSFQGSATVTVGGSASEGNVQHVGDAVTGYTAADVTYDPGDGGGLVLQVSNVDPNNPLRNLHLVAPGYAYDPISGPAQEFTDDFARRVEVFSTIRAMDWFQINNSPITDWSQRTLPTAFTRTNYYGDNPGGVAYEDLINLANQTHRDVWINVPDQASDDYVQKLAQLFAGTLEPGVKLDPSLTVHVEYSNETWNTQFDQNGRILALANANPLVAADNDYARVAQESAFKAKAVGDAFRHAFAAAAAAGGQAVPKLSVVFAGQAAGSYFAQQGLAFIQNTYGSPSQYFNELAIAPYVGDSYSVPQLDQDGLALDGLFADLNAELQTTVNGWITAHVALAKQYGLQLVAYEAGQSLANPANQDVKQAAQTDPRMGQLYQSLIALWRNDGGGTMNLYDFTGPDGVWGYWGLLTSTTQAGAPKWDSVLSMALKKGDADLDGAVTYNDFLILKANYGQSGTWWQSGDFNGDGVVDRADLEALYANLNFASLTPGQLADVLTFYAPSM